MELMESAYDKKEEARNAWGQISYENGVSYEGDCIDCVRDGYVSLFVNLVLHDLNCFLFQGNTDIQ